MKRILLTAVSLAAITVPALGAGGFSCETAENELPKVVIEGATPRSEPGLINFGAVIELEGAKIEFQKSDVKSFVGRNGVIQLRAVMQAADRRYTLRVNVKRNPKDEDDWGGTYELASASAKEKKDKTKTKAATVRGKVTCSVE